MSFTDTKATCFSGFFRWKSAPKRYPEKSFAQSREEGSSGAGRDVEVPLDNDGVEVGLRIFQLSSAMDCILIQS
jgi:hypothetical protein